MKPAPVLLADYTILLSLHGIIAAGRLLYLFLRPDDAQALPAPVPMVNYTIPLSLHGIIKTDEPRTLDFSGVRGFLVTNVCIVQRSAA